MHKTSLRPTLIGLCAVLIWGISLPVMRMVVSKTGFPGYLTLVYLTAGSLGLLLQALRSKTNLGFHLATKKAFWARFFFFTGNTVFCILAMTTVSTTNAPFTILINYLWPTLLILCSIPIAGTHVTRWRFFAAGLFIIVGSLTLELLRGDQLANSLFREVKDCLAYIAGLTGALCWALNSSISKRSGNATGGSSVIPLFQIAIGLSGLIYCLTKGIPLLENLDNVWLMITVAVGILLLISNLAWDFGMREGDVVLLSLAADFIPWISLASFSMLFDVRIETRTVFAAMLLVTGAIITRYGTRPFIPKPVRKS